MMEDEDGLNEERSLLYPKLPTYKETIKKFGIIEFSLGMIATVGLAFPITYFIYRDMKSDYKNKSSK